MTPTINSKKTTKASGRQTNNSLSSISENIFIDNPLSSKSKANNSKKLISCGKDASRVSNTKKTKSSIGSKINAKSEKKIERSPANQKQKASSSTILTEAEEVLQIGMHKVLEHVKNHKDAWPFMDPVEEDIAPRYYSIIRRPMDLLKMEERLDSGKYLTFTDFRNDFKLIVNNCRLYNGQNNEYTDMVNNLQHAFEKATKKYFEQNSSDEDDDLEYPDLKTNVFREKSNAKNTITPKIKEIIGAKGLIAKSNNNKKIAHDTSDTLNKSTTSDKMVTSKENSPEKRGRKRKQTFKEKRNTNKMDKSDIPTSITEDLDAKIEISDVVIPAEGDEGKKIVPAKKLKKNDSSNKTDNIDNVKKDDKPKTSKKTKKLLVARELSSAKGKRKNERNERNEKNDDELREIECEKEQTKKKKKTRAVEKNEKNFDAGEGNKEDLKELKKLKSNKKRKTGEIQDSYEFDDTDETPAKERKNLRAKKQDKRSVKKDSMKQKQNDKKEKEKSPESKKKVKAVKQKVKKVEQGEKDEDDDARSELSMASNTSSMSVTVTKFAIDLHQKYAKSASINKIESSLKAVPKSNGGNREHSPALSRFSSDDSNSTSVKDKFDLIKERRNRTLNPDDKCKQVVKHADKINDKNKGKSTTVTNGPKVQEKNQKLKETIEKLKQKNKQSKKLLNKLSEAKSPNPNKAEEKGVFDLLKESKPIKTNTKSVDDLAILEAESVGVDITESNNKKSPNKNHKDKATKLQKKLTKSTGKNNNTANMEALELETEQTLKDINRWLEHTPRFSEFHSASNSPIRFNNLMDDFDTVTSKLDPADFHRPLPITTDSTPITFGTHQPKNANTPPNNTQKPVNNKSLPDGLSNLVTAKENKPKQTIQLTGIPPPPGPHKRDKEPKKKALKEKVSAITPKRKDVHRTIERMQPGKTKGNLIGTISKPDEISILGTSNTNKLKDNKNSLVQETDDSGPKLSLGSVLNTAGFGLIQQHNFADNENTKDDDLQCDSTSKDACSDDMELEEIVTSTEQLARERERKEKEENEKSLKMPQSAADKTATPNLNAWLKAFGLPKKQKKAEEEEIDKTNKNQEKNNVNFETQNTITQTKSNSPLAANEQSISQLPMHRTRKASTGSTISERSSYSQDPDSPRIGIDERICGSYPASYASPLQTSPIMTSPKDDVQLKPSSPYAINGNIRVGFYQDTTTKSSPEKSCSPREQPSASPYSNYAQHLYVSTTTSGSSNAYSNMTYTSPVKVDQNAPLGFNNKNKTPSYFDQYKQPKSQDSDYNSSVGSNPNSPYQNQHSPYQSENSPYQSQTSPYTQQPNSIQSNASSQPINLNSPNSPYVAPNSPYQNQQTSPYQDMQQQHSPYASQTAPQDNPQPSVNYHSSPSSPFPQAKADPLYNPADVHTHHLASLPKTSPQAIHSQAILPHISSSNTQILDKVTQNAMQFTLPYSNQHHYVNLADPPAPSVINSSSTLQTEKPKSDEEQRDILNLDYQKDTNKSSQNSKPSDALGVDSLSKPHGYDPMFEPMGFNKTYDISSTKAIEMFNRAATMSFSKTFSTPLSVGSKVENSDLTNLTNRSSTGLLNTYPSMHANYSLYSLDNKSSHLSYNSHELNAQIQQVQQPENTVKHGLYNTDMLSVSSPTAATMPNDNRIKSNDLSASGIPHRYDVPSYDANIRNIIHPLIDDNMNNSNCYYPPKDHTGQNIYGKNVLPASQTPQVNNLPQTNPYNMSRERHQQLSTATQIPPQVTETKPKRTRKKKSAETVSQPQQSPVINNHQILQQQNLGWNSLDANNHSNTIAPVPSQQSATTHSSIHNQQQQHQQHSLQPIPTQGFQSYTALKPQSQSTALGKNTPPSETTAISLKTNSIVPGSAFNFGPTSSGSLALGGIYSENTPYLEEYRASANPYYLPPQTHRNSASSDQTTDTNAVAAGPPATSYVTASRGTPSPAPTYHQFLPPHHPYTNSQFYQQYLRTEEYRQRMMFANQGLLPHGSPTGYPQTGYHPALGMHKPYGW